MRFFRRWVLGNPPNCFGVFFSVLLVLGFLREGFFGRFLLVLGGTAVVFVPALCFGKSP